MAHNLKANAALLNQLLDGGIQTTFNSGFLNIRSGTQPADASLSETGTLLVSIALPADAFSASAGGIMDSTGTWETLSAAATGVGTWFRLKNTGDTMRFDGSVGDIGDTQLASTATGAATASLIDAAAGMVANEHLGRDIVITSGTGIGQRRIILANDSTTFYVNKVWDTQPVAGSGYRVDTGYDLRLSNSSIVATEPLRLNTVSFDFSCLI